MSGVAKKSSKKKSKTINQISCCECLNPKDKGIPKYKQPLCTNIDPLYHINSNEEDLKTNILNNLTLMRSFLKTKQVWIDDNIFDWTDANSKSPLLKIIYKILNSNALDASDNKFLKIMSKAILTDQDHDFLSGDDRTKFDKTKCKELDDTLSIIGLRKCLTSPKSQDKLTISVIKTVAWVDFLNRTVNPDPNKKLEGIEYMINDTKPPKLLNVIEDIKEIYTITSYIDSAPCTSNNIPSTNLCPKYNLSNNIEFIITNLAFAFYQSFFKELSEFSFYIRCKNNCNKEYNNLLHGTKVFTIIIKHTTSGNRHRFEGVGGDEGDFTVPRITRTLAVCNVLCPKIVNLIDWLTKKCGIKDETKIRKIIINLNILMKGFGDFCQMFMCLFLYFIKINTVDAAGNAQICVFNKNIILTTCDSYLAQIALLCNCPHIIGHCSEENHRWIFIDSNSIYLDKTLYRCWNDFYNIQLVVGNDNGTDRKVRQFTNMTTFNESCFCFEYGDKAIDKSTFLNNLTKNLISYQKQLVLFEKEYAILHQPGTLNTFVLHLSPEDIRLNTLTTINNIYTNPLHPLTTDKKITFVFDTDYKLYTIYDAGNIPSLKPLITTLYEFIELILTVHAICKFYEQVFTTSITKIVYTNKKHTQVQLLNDSSIVNKIKVSKIKTELKTTDDIIQGELESLIAVSLVSSKFDDISDIDFESFKKTLESMRDKGFDEKTFLKGEIKGGEGLLDPLIAWAKLEQFNKENSDDGHIMSFKEYFDTAKFGTGNNSIQNLIKTFKILDLTASTIIMYKELLSNMNTLRHHITEIKGKIKYRIIDGENIMENDVKNLNENIIDLETKISRLKNFYSQLNSNGYIDTINKANEQLKLIIEYLHDDNNLTGLHKSVKGHLAGFVGDSKKAGILEKLLASVFKNIYSNIAIITTDCGGECSEVCVSDKAPGGPQSTKPDAPEAAATGAQAGGNKKHSKHSIQLKRKGTFKGGFNLSESSQKLYNLCENYELEKPYNNLSIANELSLLYSSEFTNILLSNDMLATIQMTSTAIAVKGTKSSNSANSAIGVIFKNYTNKLFYNYFTYILIWTFTRHMETNLAKFKHFVECYRLLIIEKNRFVGNIVNQFAYYLSKNPESEAVADALLNTFNLYEGADLTILDEYYKMIETLTQRTLDFPHIFNEFIKETLDLSSALVEHDRLLSQQSENQNIEAILFNIVPFYIRLFTANFEMIYHFVSGYVIQFHQPSQNKNHMPQNIESMLEPIIGSINRKISAHKTKIKKLRTDIGNLDTKIRSIPLRNQRQKERGQGNQDDDRKRDRVLERKRYSKSSNELKKLKSTKTAKSTELDILVAELKNLQDDLEDVQKLYTLSSKMSPALVKYSELNAYINESYWRPDELPAIEKFQELHIITPPIVIGICQYFNDIITELIKQKKKNALLTIISKIDTKITGLKKTMSRPKNTQREKDTEKERGRERGKKSSRDSRRRRRSRSRRSRESGKKDTNTAMEGSVDDIKVELKKLKDLKETKLDELTRMNGGVSSIKSGNKPKTTNTINTTNKADLTKYKLRVEQYKNKEFTSYFEKKLRGYINDPSINIYTIGIRKMKDILKNIYNIPK